MKNINIKAFGLLLLFFVCGLHNAQGQNKELFIFHTNDTHSRLEPMDVKKGDNVIISKYAGTEVKYEGVEYIIIKQDDILAIVE